MKEHKPYDAVYEDIYDFDDINGLSKDTKRPDKTFTLDEYGDIARPTYHPKVKDDRVRLPPILVGNTPAKSGITKLLETSSAKIWDINKEREIYNGREMHKYSKPVHAIHEEILRSRVESPNYTRAFDKCPHMLEYERRNIIRKHTDLPRVLSKQPDHAPVVSKDELGVGEVFLRRVREYEESIKASSRVHAPAYKPAPPIAPKPEDDKSSYSRSRRYLRQSSTQLEQDVSVHNAPKFYHRPRTPAPEVEINYDYEVQEAIRVQKEFDLLHQELAKMKETEMVNGVHMIRPTTAATANSNLPGCRTPSQTNTPALPHLSAGPVKPWNGNTAKRGLGFKSKAKQEEHKEAKKLDVGLIPDKIRRKMKKYFH